VERKFNDGIDAGQSVLRAPPLAGGSANGETPAATASGSRFPVGGRIVMAGLELLTAADDLDLQFRAHRFV